MTDRIPGAPGQYTLTLTPEQLQKLMAAESCTVTLVRNDQPIVGGTPYNKASVLLDELAAGHLQTQVDTLSGEVQEQRAADAALAGEVQVFGCILPADGWTLEAEEGDEAAADGPAVYTQTATCPGLLAAYDLEAPQVPVVGVGNGFRFERRAGCPLRSGQ